MTNITNTERLALERIAGLSMSQFATVGDMASECVKVARAALAEAEGQADGCVSVDALSRMVEPIGGVAAGQPGYHWRRGWNAALRRAMDYAAAPEAPAAQAPKVQECNDTDSPWLVCETCNAVGKCAQPVPAAPTVAEPVALWWRHRITDQVGVVLADYVIPEELDAKWFVVRPLTFADHPPAPRERLTVGDIRRWLDLPFISDAKAKEISETLLAHGIGTDREGG